MVDLKFVRREFPYTSLAYSLPTHPDIYIPKSYLNELRREAMRAYGLSDSESKIFVDVYTAEQYPRTLSHETEHIVTGKSAPKGIKFKSGLAIHSPYFQVLDEQSKEAAIRKALYASVGPDVAEMLLD